MDFIALYCIVPNGNLQDLPKHLNEHPRVPEQNLLPQNIVWHTREASRPPEGGCFRMAGSYVRLLRARMFQRVVFLSARSAACVSRHAFYFISSTMNSVSYDAIGILQTTFFFRQFVSEARRTTDSTPPRLPSTNSTPPNPTPRGGGRGIPIHQTAHLGKEGGGFPINPHHRRGAASQTIWGGGGAGRPARDHVYIYKLYIKYIYIYINICTYVPLPLPHLREEVYHPSGHGRSAWHLRAHHGSCELSPRASMRSPVSVKSDEALVIESSRIPGRC